jgi:hypothetical protein
MIAGFIENKCNADGGIRSARRCLTTERQHQAVCVWLAVPYTIVIVFEVVKSWALHEDRSDDGGSCTQSCGTDSSPDTTKIGWIDE